MDLKIKLEDEECCGGCPMANVDGMVCAAGFKRERAKMLEEMQPVRLPFSMTTVDRLTLGFNPIRPMACVVANERALAVVDKIPVKTGKSKAAEAWLKSLDRKKK